MNEMSNEKEIKQANRQDSGPAAKRPRVPLKFSIESIMQPYQQQQPNYNQQAGTRTSSSSPETPPTCSLLSSSSSSSTSIISKNLDLDELSNVKCRLDNKDIWDQFHALNTEMIITKQGRRMFPPVRVTFSLDNNDNNNDLLLLQSTQQQLPLLNGRDKYQVLMDILPYDKKRYRYAYHKSAWQQAGKADPPSPTKLFLHPDGPFTLDQLRRQSVISFEKIKLTNNDTNKHGYIVLNSMHKYQPRIHLVRWRGKESASLANAPISALDSEPHKTFVFRETIFTAVTAYQNHSITKLKIDSNPFAKGFRDSTRLTDLELESMQDLISDGQCPFSPPRAPPPGFPHFLFSAAAMAAASGQYGPPGSGGPHAHLTMSGPMASQQQQQLSSNCEDPAAVLLRERTIMALDSFLQHQQQQQQSIDATNQRVGGPHDSNSPASQLVGGGHQCAGSTTDTPTPTTTAASGNCLATPTSVTTTPTSGTNGPPPPPPGGALEQFIMQQQLAAAMAAAAAAAATHGHHQHQHPLLCDARTGSPPTYTSSAGMMMTQLNQQQQQHYQQQHVSNEQTSPIGAAKSAARSQMMANDFFAPPQPPPGGVTNSSYQAHLQALIMHHYQRQQQQHQHQMATLAQIQTPQQLPAAGGPEYQSLSRPSSGDDTNGVGGQPQAEVVQQKTARVGREKQSPSRV